MRVSAAVDESDIAKVQVGQRADVTVDAFPGRRFAGTVAQVRLQPTVVSNVTTYATIIDVANERRELKPGMTAAAEVEIDRRTNVVRIPNTALRFRPTPEILAALDQAAVPVHAGARTEPGSSRVVRVANTPPAEPAESGQGTGAQVWVRDPDAIRSVDVLVGLSDGTNTELLQDSLVPGTELITAVTLDGDGPEQAVPSRSIFGGGRRRS
jgi:HlyD family secretion protein